MLALDALVPLLEGAEEGDTSRRAAESGGYCHSPHLARRWREEEDYAEEARRSNEVLLAFTRTTYRVGDEVLLEGRTRVRITAVQPVGFITVPRKYGNLGRLLPAVACDVEIYQYRGMAPGSATGQTSVDRLSPLATAKG